eukprot:4517384-Amphidinium_carterae.1
MESDALRECELRLAARGRLWWVHLSPPGAGWSIHLVQHAVQRATDRSIDGEPMVTFMARLCEFFFWCGGVFGALKTPLLVGCDLLFLLRRWLENLVFTPWCWTTRTLESLVAVREKQLVYLIVNIFAVFMLVVVVVVILGPSLFPTSLLGGACAPNGPLASTPWSWSVALPTSSPTSPRPFVRGDFARYAAHRYSASFCTVCRRSEDFDVINTGPMMASQPNQFTSEVKRIKIDGVKRNGLNQAGQGWRAIPSRMRGIYLEKRSLAPATFIKYKTYCKSVSDFDRWVRALKLRLDSLSELDAMVARYLYKLYFDGRGVSLGRFVVYGIIFLRSNRFHLSKADQLPKSLKCIKGWVKLAPQRVHDPCPYSVCCWHASHFVDSRKVLLAVLAFGVVEVCRSDFFPPQLKKDKLRPRSWGLVIAPASPGLRQEDPRPKRALMMNTLASHVSVLCQSHRES